MNDPARPSARSWTRSASRSPGSAPRPVSRGGAPPVGAAPPPPQGEEHAGEAHGMPERIALLEGDDVDARKTLGDAPATRWQEEVDARRGKELGERARERHGEEGVAHAIVP